MQLHFGNSYSSLINLRAPIVYCLCWYIRIRTFFCKLYYQSSRFSTWKVYLLYTVRNVYTYYQKVSFIHVKVRITIVHTARKSKIAQQNATISTLWTCILIDFTVCVIFFFVFFSSCWVSTEFAGCTVNPVLNRESRGRIKLASGGKWWLHENKGQFTITNIIDHKNWQPNAAGCFLEATTSTSMAVFTLRGCCE